MIEILVRYSDDAEDTLRFEEPVGIDKISLALYKCFNRRGVEVVSATTNVVSGKIMIFTSDDGEVLLNGREPNEDQIIQAGDEEPLYLAVTMVEGGIQSEQKRKLAGPGESISMGKILLQVMKYFNKRSLQVQEARIIITEKKKVVFDLSEDGEITVNGEIPEPGLQFTSSFAAPPPPPLKLTPQATPQVTPQVQPANVVALNPNDEIAELRKKLAEVEARQGKGQGIVVPSADEIQEYGGIAAQGTGQVPGAQSAGSAVAQGGGRQPKKVPPGSQLASWAAEYELFQPHPHEVADGISTIGYPRQTKMMEYRPPGADGEVRAIVPRGTRLVAICFLANQKGDMAWHVQDPRTRREYVIQDICLTSPMNLDARVYGDDKHAPLHLLDYTPEQQKGRVTGTLTTTHGTVPVFDRIELENLDEQVASATRRPSGRSLEEMAISQVENKQGPTISGISENKTILPGRRPSIKMMEGISPEVVKRLQS